VTFASDATNLVSGDTNGKTDVFVRDLVNDSTERVSVDSGGVQGNDISDGPTTISSDGRYVTFISVATNLVSADTNGHNDVFLRDRQLGTTKLVSLDSGGLQANGHSTDASITPDGRFVAFTSFATNLVPGDTNGKLDVFVRDLQNSKTERVSLGSGGVQGDGDSLSQTISADGRCIAFRSAATNLVSGDANGFVDVFVRDRPSGITRRVSVDSNGAEANANSGYNSQPVSISADGKFVAFDSFASNLVPGDLNGGNDVFLCDLRIPATEITQRVSVDSGEAQQLSASTFAFPSISADGRYVAFLSNAANLVPGDTNGFDDVFVRDRVAGTTERVSVDSAGTQGNNASGDYGSGFAISISSDGRYVAFASYASNLVPLDSNGNWDVFVHDRQSGTTERVSVATGGTQGSGDAQSVGQNVSVSISADGRYVAFASEAPDLVPGDTFNSLDIFVHDRQSGITERVNLAWNGTTGGPAYIPSISADGRYVAFLTLSNLTVGDTNGAYDVFVRDRQSGTTERVSVDSSGVQGNMDSGRYGLKISADGRYVAFSSSATNLVPGDMNGFEDIFLRDRQNGTTERVSVDSIGTQGGGISYSPSISADGRFVAFASDATNLVSGDTNGMGDVFVRNRESGTTERASVDSGGVQGNSDWSGYPSISNDGRSVAFVSGANNLVSGDTNACRDVFVRDRNATGFTTLCDPGVGGVRTCPCSNPPSGPGRGCDNSAGTGGAILSASGVAYLSSDSLVFTTSGEKPTALSTVWQGPTSPAAGIVYGQGVRCVNGSLKRLYNKSAVAGSITAPNFGAGDPAVSARSAAKGDVIQPGQVRYYFVSYRDPIVLGGCPSTSTQNATQTGVVAWSP
jgi:Tol biopolymer transport system component